MDKFGQFSLGIFAISKYWHKIADEELKKYGIKGPYSLYLTLALPYEDGLTAAEMVELSGKDKADFSRAAKTFEENGLVERCGEGVYKKKIRLTDKGREIANVINERAKKAVELGGSTLTDEEREIFYKVLGTISNNLKDLSRKGIPE